MVQQVRRTGERAKVKGKAAEEQSKPPEVPPPVTQPANPPPAETGEPKNKVAKIYSDFWDGLTVEQIAAKYKIDEPMVRRYRKAYLVMVDTVRNMLPAEPEGDIL